MKKRILIIVTTLASLGLPGVSSASDYDPAPTPCTTCGTTINSDPSASSTSGVTLGTIAPVTTSGSTATVGDIKPTLIANPVATGGDANSTAHAAANPVLTQTANPISNADATAHVVSNPISNSGATAKVDIEKGAFAGGAGGAGGQGGAGGLGGTGGTGGNATVESGAVRSDVSANGEANFTLGDGAVRGGSSDQKQSQGQDQRQSASSDQQQSASSNQQQSANNQGNNLSVNQNYKRNTPPAVAPSIYQNSPCAGPSAAGGASGPGFAFSFGTANIDKECQINAAELTLRQMRDIYGDEAATDMAIRIRCKSELLGINDEECSFYRELAKKAVLARQEAAQVVVAPAPVVATQAIETEKVKTFRREAYACWYGDPAKRPATTDDGIPVKQCKARKDLVRGERIIPLVDEEVEVLRK